MTMPPENNSIPATSKDESRSSGSRKTPPEQGLRCPRCDSPNTKFCYYNNYSLTQPRHFCKTCRRYWTKGGALRNVPIGGGCRKNKKIKSSTSSRFSGGDNNNSNNSTGSTSELGGFKFFQGISPAMDFQLPNFPKIYNHQNQYPNSYNTGPCLGVETTLGNSFSSPLMGFNFPISDVMMMKQGGESSTGNGFNVGIQDQLMMGNSVNLHSNLASSIESLSCINQDLHWKLQQQRLAMLFGGEDQNQKEILENNIINNNHVQKPQPIMFQNLEIEKPEGVSGGVLGGNSRKEGVDIATEWFFESSAYAPPVNQNPTNTNGNNEEGTSNWNGIQAWNDLNQYSALP